MASTELTSELTLFFQNIAAWPGTEPDLSGVAVKIAQLCRAPFVSIVDLTTDRIGLALNGSGYRGGSEGPIREHLRKQLKLRASPQAAETVDPIFETLPLAREHAPFFDPAVRMLTFASIGAEMRSGPSLRDQRVQRHVGWLIIGTERAPEPALELLMLGVARRLAELWEIAEMESMIAMRGQFLSIASHELKTPLTSIYGVLQLQERMLRLKKDEPETVQLERQHSFLKMVIRQVERLNELIDGLLDVSRIQNGRFMVEPSEADVAVILKEALSARLAVIASEAGVRLVPEAPNTLMAWVDPVRMEEVITNLVMNAIRFSPEGGTVWVRLTEDGGAFRFTVRDQGPAVPIEDRERIFQPFERAQRTARLGGLGLGLFISRQIAQLHGGNVTLVESVPGKGNVFEAYFPLREVNSISA